MKNCLYILPLFIAAFLACGKTGVEPPVDASDNDAVYHIMIYDSPNAFKLDLMDRSIPDTTAPLTASNPIQWWRTIYHDSLDIDIQVFYPGQHDTTGAVPYANVTELKYFWGTLEVIAIDTTGDSWRRVRLSKNFVMLGSINAVFQQLGSDYNTRRGWRLMQISDATFIPRPSGGHTPVSPRVEVQTQDSLLNINPSAVKALRYLPQFTPGESVTVNIYPTDTTSAVSLRYPAGNSLASKNLSLQPGGVFQGGFTFQRLEDYGHFLADVINPSALEDSAAAYIPNAVGAIYKVR